ncbi:unnamed protein product [Meloidogyne enterolobii]|uniref:Uncharacterized protein n=1 Tax=Meloidogyne enterolobii TaxID=390850 RepID=A0ACB0Z989_MELEN
MNFKMVGSVCKWIAGENFKYFRRGYCNISWGNLKEVECTSYRIYAFIINFLKSHF